MLPLIGLAATFVPDLIRLIAGDKAGTVTDAVTKTISDVVKTTDPVEALKALQGDAAVAAELRTRLAQIAVDAQKAQNEEAEKKRQTELATLQATFGDTKDARGNLLALTQAHSDIAWGAPVVSLVVTLGFFVILCVLILFPKSAGLETNSMVGQIVNITVGTLATGFATVVNFWLGSSQGSRNKDATSLQMQANSATQLSNVLDTMKSVASNAVTVAAAPAQAVVSAFAPAVAPAGTTTTTTTVTAGPPAQARPGNFDRCVAVTLAYEGGFSDNPADPGGATNFGITKRTLEAFLGHSVTVDDVHNLSTTTAIEIYRANYWNQMRCGDLPAGVDLMVFDFGVNSGPATSVKALQELVGVTRDGAIGAHTLAAVAKQVPSTLVNDLAEARMTFLRGLQTFETFGNGWARRVEDVKQKALQMAGATT